MARHAERPSTWCKLSGMLTEVGPVRTDAHLQPHVEFLFEHFGTDRVIFASDWPVRRELLDYPELIRLNVRLTSSLSPTRLSASGGPTASGSTASRSLNPQPPPS